MEIQLVPSSLPIKGKPRHDTVCCYAPSAFMFGPAKLAVSAERLSRNRWKVFNVPNPRSWWTRRQRYYVPRIGRHLRYLTWFSGYSVKYNYLRETWIAATTEHIECDALGPDCFVVAYDYLVNPLADLNTGVRRVLYLSTLPDDGLEIPPDATCVPPGVPAPAGTVIRINRPSDKQWSEAEAHRIAYCEYLTARDEGRTVFNNLKWLTPQEYDRQIAADEARSTWLRRAHGGTA